MHGDIGQKERLMSYVANIVVNLWSHDLLQGLNAQINIPAIPEAEHKSIKISGTDIIRYYKQTVTNCSEKL